MRGTSSPNGMPHLPLATLTSIGPVGPIPAESTLPCSYDVHLFCARGTNERRTSRATYFLPVWVQPDQWRSESQGVNGASRLGWTYHAFVNVYKTTRHSSGLVPDSA